MASERTLEALSSPSSFSYPLRDYDVFLSFRGGDTRKNFTNHLCHALQDAGINIYMDDGELRKGGNIAVELPKAIQESRISIIVFSRDYAASRWCLDELVKIMECHKTLQQVVLPIFYDVSPSQVRHGTGSFGEAFAKHKERFSEEMERVLRWKDALTQAADLSGWDLTSAENG
ncbi:hypothetical protein L1049_016460 [Liquidambar formosana]|uniref:ADP-ribosyl cyclase/cyclic ADP-ribose hydrolase n=1 Tax=Liquidambar formosana TaxID=63359 RepID=A0AAP0RZF0_LIQFO